jgi:hypothetical protein
VPHGARVQASRPELGVRAAREGRVASGCVADVGDPDAEAAWAPHGDALSRALACESVASRHDDAVPIPLSLL